MSLTTRLRLGETELRRELDSFGRRQVFLNVEAFLQTVELRIAKDGPGLASAAVFRQVVDGADCAADDARAHCSGADVV